MLYKLGWIILLISISSWLVHANYYGGSYSPNHGYNHGYNYQDHGDGTHVYGHHVKTTCADHYKPGIKNGFYLIYSLYHLRSMDVLCDFESERGMAYTMVMSSTTHVRAGYVGASTADPFKVKGLNLVETATDKNHVNPDKPNFYAYRQARDDMVRIRDHSEVWRMVCLDSIGDDSSNDPVEIDELYNGYIRVKISDADPLAELTGCYNVEYAKSLNLACQNCEVALSQADGTTLKAIDSSGCTPAFTGSGANTFEMAAGVGACSKNVTFWFGKNIRR